MNRTVCFYCGGAMDSGTRRCRSCGAPAPRGRRRSAALSLLQQAALLALLLGTSLGYLAFGDIEQQARARGALAGSLVVTVVGVGLMRFWPWPRAGLVDAHWQAYLRRRFGGGQQP